MVTPLALVGVERSGLCQNRHFASGYTSFTHASSASIDPFTVRAALGPARPTLIHPVPHPQHDYILPSPSQRPGPAAYWSSPPLDLTSHRHLRVSEPALHPTNLLLLQSSLLSKGTTTYQVMHTPPSITFFMHLPSLPIHLSLPPPLGPALSPPSSCFTSRLLFWFFAHSHLATHQFLLYTMFPHQGPLHMLIPCVQHLCLALLLSLLSTCSYCHLRLIHCLSLH